ncbi:MAG TPA: PAS domain S-box protein [Alphaproteobacteria bacterium]|nr:PAS domain S-box protein [Alphaproteobacteria bacterium]
MTLFQRALVLVAVALLPAVAILGFNEFTLRSARQAEVHDQVLREADAVARDLNRLFEGVKNLLIALSLVPEVVNADTGACNPLFVRVTQADPNFLNIATADTSGRILCTAVPLRNPAISAKGRPYFRAIDRNEFTVGEFTVGQSVGLNVLQLAYPLRDEAGQPAGVIWVALKLGVLQGHLSRLQLAPGATLALADRNGTVLAAVPNGLVVGTQLAEPLADLRHRPAPGTHESGEGEGRPMVYGYIPLSAPPHDLLILYGVDRAAAFASLHQATVRGVLLIGVGIALALALAYFGAKRFIEAPLAQLIGTLDRWLSGDHSARATLMDKHFEIGRLGAGFNALAEAIGAREAALRHRAQEFAAVFEFAGRGKAVVDPSSRRFLRVNRAFCEMLGYAPDELLQLTVNDITHPEHRAEDKGAFERLLQGEVTSFDREKRYLRKDGSAIWGRANVTLVRDSHGNPAQFIGVVEDITERIMSEARTKLLMAEVDHRAKNALATIQAIIRLTKADSIQAYVAALSGRIHALARAHTLLANSRWAGADLRRLAEEELGAYTDPTRIAVAGPTVLLPPSSAQAVAMALHELATNAAKHGALSREAGRVSVEWAWDNDRLVIRWIETGGPTVAAPTRRGFGSGLITTMITGQLGGDVSMDWRREGLACTLAIPREQLMMRTSV